MKQLFFILFISFVFLSCDSDSEEEKEKIPETYSLKKIDYYIIENSVEFLSINLPAIIYTNEGSLEQKWSYSPLEGQSDKSQFTSEDTDAFKVDDIDVFVPLYIDEDSAISLDSRKWKYSNGIEKQEPNINLSEDIPVPANQKATINCELFFRKYTVNYKLYLEDNQTKEEKVVEGKWTGTYPDYSRIKATYSDL